MYVTAEVNFTTGTDAESSFRWQARFIFKAQMMDQSSKTEQSFHISKIIHCFSVPREFSFVYIDMFPAPSSLVRLML
jgi:hypothetical protein